MSFAGWLRPFRRKPDSPAGSPPGPEVLRRVRRIELRSRGLVESLFSGEYLSVFHGRGFELSHIRGYQPGDDVRAIDWKVTARRGIPFVRQFVEERDLLIALVVDVSASGQFGPGERSAAEVAAEIAGALAFAALRNNDRIALVLASDQVELFRPPASGRRHVVGLLAELLQHRPRRSGTDLTPALELLTRSLAHRALVFLVSDFIQHPRNPSFLSAVTRCAQRNRLVAIRLASAAADVLPDVGWVEMTDPESGRRVVVDAGSRRVREHYHRSVVHARAECAALLAERDVELVEINTAADPLQALADFFRRQRRVTR